MLAAARRSRCHLCHCALAHCLLLLLHFLLHLLLPPRLFVELNQVALGSDHADGVVRSDGAVVGDIVKDIVRPPQGAVTRAQARGWRLGPGIGRGRGSL